MEVRPIKILTLKAILLLEKDDQVPAGLKHWAQKEINKIDDLEIVLAAKELGYGC